MFNVREKIYVTTDREVDLIKNRVIVVHEDFESVVFDFLADADDPAAVGLVFKAATVEDLLNNHFGGSLENFYTYLTTENDMKIVASETEYVRLYAQVLLEMQDAFGVSDAHVAEVLEYQRLKEFLMGDRLPTFQLMYDTLKATYTPVGNLYSSSEVTSLPFEVVYALYKWNYITKTLTNEKIATIAPLLLQGQLNNVMASLKIALGKSPIAIQEYLSDNSITTVDEIIAAIDTNPILRKAIVENSEFDLSNSTELTEAINLVNIVIDNDFDYDAQPTVDKAELQFFVDLFNSNDVDVIDNAKYNFFSTGYAAERAQKFNAVLMMNID